MTAPRLLPRTPWPLLLALALGACGSGDAAPPAERVVLITCDTLRADHLGAYGAPQTATPELDAFAREGVVFDRAYAAAPLTLPALSSLMTGRYPDELGAGSNQVLMPGAATTLAEVVAAAGIPTAAVVSNWVLRARGKGGTTGIEQGFGHYDARMEDTEVNRQRVQERLAADTTDAALHWLRERPGDRFFLWVHYQDPHGPYTPPEAFAVPDPPSSGRLLPAGRDNKGRGAIPAYQLLGHERDPAVYGARYRAEIRYFDHELGRLLDGLAEAGLDRDALVLFTADHGESLGENGWWFSHGQTLQAELVRVPLIVRFPGGTSPHGAPRDGLRRHPGPVGHVDVFATVLAAFGLPARPSQGLSLFGSELPTERILVQSVREPGAPDRWQAVTDGRWRLVEDPLGARLYDLDRDPGEQEDLAAAEPERVALLRRRFAEAHASLPPLGERALRDELDAEALRAMESLGYVDAVEGDDHGDH